MLKALRLSHQKEEPNDIFIMTSPSKLKHPNSSLSHLLCLSINNSQDGGSNNGTNKNRLYSLTVVLAAMLLFFHSMSPTSRSSSSDYNPSSSSSMGLLRTNRFSYTNINSPYEQIWINSHLPSWAKKVHPFRDMESQIKPEERICYVHVGKAGGSSVGCSLGFKLHCQNHTQKPLEGLLPQRTTRMFHADTYDCNDDSAYFLFVVRNPVERLKSAFLYDRPKSEASLKKSYPEYYERRKNLYLDCPSFGIMEQFVQDGLTSSGKASEVCKLRAKFSVNGERHFSCHMYFNYQFHLEGIPKDGKVLVIRNEHLIHDWNHVEHFIGGGVKEIIDPNRGNETIGVMNKSKKDQSHKQLSKDSTKIICRQLCNEIVSYKKILRRSLNLNYQDIEESIEELRETCGKYADYEEGDCSVPMPDITEKLIVNRGYNDVVMEKEYISQSEKLETTLHTSNTDEKLEAQALMDDDSYSI